MPLNKYKNNEVTGPKMSASNPNINKSFMAKSIAHNNIANNGK